MYFGDKVALEDLWNCSICVRTDNGIRNINHEQDVIVENLAYIENIGTTERGRINIIQKGEMVRYRPVVAILR